MIIVNLGFSIIKVGETQAEINRTYESHLTSPSNRDLPSLMVFEKYDFYGLVFILKLRSL